MTLPANFEQFTRDDLERWLAEQRGAGQSLPATAWESTGPGPKVRHVEVDLTALGVPDEWEVDEWATFQDGSKAVLVLRPADSEEEP